MYSVDRWAENWTQTSARKRRPLESVVLDGDLSSRILDDVDQFLSSEEWYTARGIPWRRGYLFHGPPGTGKTSLIFALAGKLELSLCILSLSDPRLSDHNLTLLFQRTPPRSIIVFEDVDNFFGSRDKKKDEAPRISFSGFLNAIDGLAAQEGRLLAMTTNHLERLDPALTRPGRADVIIALERATRDQAKRLFLQFFPNRDDLAVRFSQVIPDGKLSPAQIQQVLLLANKVPDRALELIAAVE